MWVIKCYGVSCNYFMSRDLTGVLSKSEAGCYLEEEGARAVAALLYKTGRIGHWEIVRAW